MASSILHFGVSLLMFLAFIQFDIWHIKLEIPKLIKELHYISKELEKYHDLDISDGTLKSRFDVIKAKLKEYKDGKFELTGELLHSFINKILVVDKEHII